MWGKIRRESSRKNVEESIADIKCERDDRA
jgi:hypothetical protein